MRNDVSVWLMSRTYKWEVLLDGDFTSTNPKLSKEIMEKIGHGCPTPGRARRLTVGRNITLTLIEFIAVWRRVRIPSVSHKKRRKGNPVPRGINGHPIPGRYKNMNLALHVGGVSNETVKYGCGFCGTCTKE
jgi:hypothetical protein